MSAPTAQQKLAVAATGNVLVVAGAGTGKTHTLVERCIDRVCAAANPVSLENVLLVTFTEAAAAEMRKRLRDELEKRAAAAPENTWLAEQLALVETARISTLHSFCLQLVREHFHELDLDPQLAVLAEEQSRLLARETLDQMLQRHYASATPVAEAVQQLVLDHGRGGDEPIRTLTLHLHHYTQTLRDPAAWFAEQLTRLAEPTPKLWNQWLREGFAEWRELWPSVLRTQPKENTIAHTCADLLAGKSPMAVTLAKIVEYGGDNFWPRGMKGKFRDPIAALFDEAEFLHAFVVSADGTDPLAQDWDWIRPQMTSLLRLAQEFTAEFARAKRELAAVDFHDLEQFALQLLLDRATSQPTAVARHWRERLQLVFVDEYQDINAAQDTILRALGGEGTAANRFLVGDVKQSIYRFRLADPTIFQGYKTEWEKGQDGQTVPLADNFRSHESILNFVNALFASLMRREVGGVEYDEPQQLRFGAREDRKHLAAVAEEKPRTELHLILTGGEPADENDSADTTTAEREARLVAMRLSELVRDQFQIWDKDAKFFRAVTWGDMAILLRSPRAKAEVYAKVFAQAGVPLQVARGGFFESQEVMDLLSLLQALDNPLQDLPLLAVLRSPLVGLTLDELAGIRLVAGKVPFWTALVRSQMSEGSVQRTEINQKVAVFLERFARWRRLARQASLSQCLEAALDETFFESWLLAQPRGEQRRANAQRLLALTRQFDQFQRQGLFRFLKFIEAQLDADADLEPAATTSPNAVRLMSIHQSKGLDFPVVVVADLGKQFNFDDLKARVILDEQFGLCPKVKPPHTARVYPSLPYWLAQRRQRRETLGEELRLLYVATTRARDLLILTGTATHKTVTEKWTGGSAEKISTAQLLAASSFLGWLGQWLPRATGHCDWTVSGGNQLLTWTIHEESDVHLQKAGVGETATATKQSLTFGASELEILRQNLERKYPFAAATVEPAKTSVSALRRRLREETDDEARLIFASKIQGRKNTTGAAGKLSAAEIGTAHHLFLQLAACEEIRTRLDLQNERERLRQAGALSDAEAAALDMDGLLAFWESSTGRAIGAQSPEFVHREMPFTAKLSAADLRALKLSTNTALADEEFVVAQGYIDLAVILPQEIWVLDFKTDVVDAEGVAEKAVFYTPQLKLYALALARIYNRPVTKCWLHFLAARTAVTVPL
jgi:ATP-dependent helicase/nuclease subunit A